MLCFFQKYQFRKINIQVFLPDLKNEKKDSPSKRRTALLGKLNLHS